MEIKTCLINTHF